ncbi:MAG: M20 family metallopeptidase [Candidatus Latescibacter sp.]|nr:M20 family metallopeptidase [Candidatus Latescibacter sp.]
MKNSIAEIPREILETLIDIRHVLHRYPETAHKEFKTAETIETFLDGIGVRHSRCAETGVVALVGKEGGRTAALRADTDAIEVQDISGLPYTSVNKGVSHACGHDGHITILLGTAWALKQIESALPGVVKLIFQPAEESGTGAARMIRDGALSSPVPDAIFALHGWPGIPLGRIGCRSGPVMAAVDSFRITVKGSGTHGAMPHTGVDPITIAARIIEGIQLVRSRMIDPLIPFVVSVGSIHGGFSVNVIPDEVVMGGTIRTLERETRAEIIGHLERMARSTAQASGGKAFFEITESFPPNINDDRAIDLVRDAVRETLGPENIVEMKTPTMGGEDFSFFLEKIPGAYFKLGVGDRFPLHNPAFDFDDRAIPVGIGVMTGVAVRFLERGF